MWGWVGLYGRPPWVTLKALAHRCTGRMPPPPGDHKGPPPVHPTTLAPTESSIVGVFDPRYRRHFGLSAIQQDYYSPGTD